MPSAGPFGRVFGWKIRLFQEGQGGMVLSMPDSFPIIPQVCLWLLKGEAGSVEVNFFVIGKVSMPCWRETEFRSTFPPSCLSLALALQLQRNGTIKSRDGRLFNVPPSLAT